MRPFEGPTSDRPGSQRPGRRAPGRPRSFDIETATAALEHALWTHGYRASSVDDLAGAAELSPSSLYAAYGSKEGVLVAALARYVEQMGELVGLVVDGESGLDDVLAFVDRVRSVIECDGRPRGCLVVNTMVEVGDGIPLVAELTATHRRQVEQGLAAAMRRGAARGEIPASTVQDRARLVMAAVFGALAVARAGDRAGAVDVVTGLGREVRRWQVGP